MELQELRDRIKHWKAGVSREDAPRLASPEPQMSQENVAEEPAGDFDAEPIDVATEEPAEAPAGQLLAEQVNIDSELSPAVAEVLAQSAADAGMANTTAEILDPNLDVDVIEADDEELDAAESTGAEPPAVARAADAASEADPEAALEPPESASGEPASSSEPAAQPAAQGEPAAQEQSPAEQQAIAEQQAAAQALYAQLSPEHLAALQQYGQQLQGQGYSPEQIVAAQYQYAQQMVVAMQQQAGGSSAPEGGEGA